MSRSPIFWILCAATIIRFAAIGWGLPASDGWDDDGIAPRNFLVGVAQTYVPGAYFTYPPLHMILLAILTAPGWIIGLFNAPSLSQHEVIAELIRVPYMTFFAVVARLVSVAMSVGTIYLVGKMTQTIAGRRAGLFAAATCALNAALTYYGQVTNLDGPYLFWSVLSIWGFVRTIAEREPRYLRWAMLSAAAAVATKDQAYAVFLLSVPLALALWFAIDRWPRQNARILIVTLLLSTGVAVLALLIVDGVIGNPTGFAKRVAFLVGPASQDYANYQDNWTGRIALLHDMWAYFPRYYPAIAAAFGAVGIAIHAVRWREDRSRFVAGLLPMLAIASFTIAFNFMALRSESRFFLPQSVFIAVYIGIAVDTLAFASNPWIKHGARVLAFAIGIIAFYQCAGIDAAFVEDPRYDTERWLNANVRNGDVIETYGANAYLPRFPNAAIVRVGDKPLKARNPLPNVTEARQPYELVALRHPRFIVVSAFWVSDYLKRDMAKQIGGRTSPKVEQSVFRETGARHYFVALFEGKLSYRLAHKSAYISALWPLSTAYESLEQTIYVFEQIPGPPARRI